MRLSNRRKGDLVSYLKSYSSQVAYFGTHGHRRLRNSTVLVVGDGRVGHAISLALATAGVGRLILVDPQRVTGGDLNRCAMTTAVDVGRWKVDVTAGLLSGRPFLEVVPIIGSAEQLASSPDVQDVDVVVSACNTVPSRASVAEFAVGRRIPHVSAAVTDARQGVGGFVVTWTPSTPELACPACFLDRRAVVNRGESLLAPVTSLIASLAAWNVVSVLTTGRRFRMNANCVALDLGNLTLDTFLALRRAECRACGQEPGLEIARDRDE